MNNKKTIQVFWENVNTHRKRNYSHFINLSPFSLQRQLDSRILYKKTISLLKKEGFFNGFLTMLEWGCGGGMNIRNFSKHFNRVYGVDISQITLIEMKKRTNGNAVYIDIEKPESVLISHKKSIDFLLCCSVIQHFPSKEYANNILSIFSKLLVKDGYALIQTRFPVKPVKSYEKDFKHFVTYYITELNHELKKRNLKVIHEWHKDEIGYRYVFVKMTR